MDRFIDRVLRSKDKIDQFSFLSTTVGVTSMYGGIMAGRSDVVLGSAVVAGVGVGLGVVFEAFLMRYKQRYNIE